MMERNERLKAADKCASRYTDKNEARIARSSFMLGCEFEAQGEAIKGVNLSTPESENPMNPEGLEEEVEKCLKHYQMIAVGKSDFMEIARHFAEWGAEHAREQMMKEAMEKYVHELYTDEEGYHCYISLGNEYAPGDKVRIIIVKEDKK